MCKACKRDYALGPGVGAQGSLAEMRKVCSRARAKGVPAAPKRPTFANLPGGRAPFWMTDGPTARTGREVVYPREGNLVELPAGRWWEQKCVRGLSEAGRKAELARQARRLAGLDLAVSEEG